MLPCAEVVKLPSRLPKSSNDSSNAYCNQLVHNPVMSVANPDYFDDDSEIWKPKNQLRNGYHPIPNVSSPTHRSPPSTLTSVDSDSDHPYYRSMNGGLHGGHLNGGLHTKRLNSIDTKRLDSAESKIWMCWYFSLKCVDF